MAFHKHPSTGKPASDGNPGGLPFTPDGEPERVQEMGAASTQGDQDAEADAALAELGASIKKKTRSASGKSIGKPPLPTAPEGLAKSPYNRPG